MTYDKTQLITKIKTTILKIQAKITHQLYFGTVTHLSPLPPKYSTQTNTHNSLNKSLLIHKLLTQYTFKQKLQQHNLLYKLQRVLQLKVIEHRVYKPF